ncbi:MAG: transcriptional regulator [Chloroflexi bacterium]|nr:transcriptional regulator [Chloroflexota bacterium]
MDLHLHTRASLDYREPKVSYLQVLQRADERGLDIIAITDHNTVAGVAAIRTRIQELELLERLNRLHGEEKRELEEYRRLGRKMLILPGFEFTATLGFHILGIFPPETLVRELEHILLDLRIPADKLDLGSMEVGATVDVLTAYRTIAQAGGLVIAAHVNSTHGVAMRGYDFGGQTKIAYTQDPDLHALEVTDLEQTGRRTTASFYDGSKPEYPRRMHCIQGSDAHRLDRDPQDEHVLGIGDRVTEILLPEVTFEAIREVLLGSDFTRTRPYRPREQAFDYVRVALDVGPSIVQSFHERMGRRGGHLVAILRDVVAFANTNGGTIYIGVGSKPKSPVVGVDHPEEASRMLLAEITRAVVPPLAVDIDALKTQGKNVLRVTVRKGENAPYALHGVEIYVRQESETSRAMRDEIVQLVDRVRSEQTVREEPVPAAETCVPAVAESAVGTEQPILHPRTGVEIVDELEREGTKYYTLKDLRNSNVVENVTRTSARRLWRYAITERETRPVKPDKVQWHGNIGLWKSHKRLGRVRYDFVQRDAEGKIHVYYGVSDDGIHSEWRQFLTKDK